MRYIIGVIAVVILIFLGITLFRGGPKKPANQGAASKTLPEYSNTDAIVKLTMDGIINSEENHRAIRITVGREQRSIDIIQGYQNHLLNSQVYSNNESAYNVFLNSLYLSGFTKERKTSNTNETGQCPLGSRYTYELINTGDKDVSLWSTSCGGLGTFGGQGVTVRTLFERQIPNFQQLTQGITGIIY